MIESINEILKRIREWRKFKSIRFEFKIPFQVSRFNIFSGQRGTIPIGYPLDFLASRFGTISTDSVQETDILANKFIFRAGVALKERPLAREEGKERPLNADGGRTRWRWRASFKVEAYLRIPLFDFFFPPRKHACSTWLSAPKRREKRTRWGNSRRSSSFHPCHTSNIGSKV